MRQYCKEPLKVGDRVVVAQLNYCKSRPDVYMTTIKEIKVTEKQTKYTLDDGSSVIGRAKLVKMEDSYE